MRVETIRAACPVSATDATACSETALSIPCQTLDAEGPAIRNAPTQTPANSASMTCRRAAARTNATRVGSTASPAGAPAERGLGHVGTVGAPRVGGGEQYEHRRDGEHETPRGSKRRHCATSNRRRLIHGRRAGPGHRRSRRGRLWGTSISTTRVMRTLPTFHPVPRARSRTSSTQPAVVRLSQWLRNAIAPVPVTR